MCWYVCMCMGVHMHIGTENNIKCHSSGVINLIFETGYLSLAWKWQSRLGLLDGKSWNTPVSASLVLRYIPEHLTFFYIDSEFAPCTYIASNLITELLPQPPAVHIFRSCICKCYSLDGKDITTNLTQDIYWEGKSQEGGCFCSGENHSEMGWSHGLYRISSRGWKLSGWLEIRGMWSDFRASLARICRIFFFFPVKQILATFPPWGWKSPLQPSLLLELERVAGSISFLTH